MILKEFIFAGICTFGFGILFNIPRKQLPYACFAGALGWIVYSLLGRSTDSPVMAAFAGAFSVGTASEIFARIKRMPATVYVIPGLIPLVPGYGLYYSMLKIVEADYTSATDVGVETILVAVAISSAIIVTTSLGKRFKGKKHINKQES
ncbi:MAG: threonine/serine exporter family protein [Tissierellales bacterium]|nr:threonine/serine exporter family protein [Tissierellales bacterium]MBN2826397.1 threonine/serine exporter family protein [Tissierellales bacterium]